MHAGDGSRGARRVLVSGVTGSEKTTAAARISDAVGIPWTSVDDLTWEPAGVAGLPRTSGEPAPGPVPDGSGGDAPGEAHGEVRR